MLLGDADPDVQGQALAFWHSALPRTLSARLAALLSDSLEDASAWVGALLMSSYSLSRLANLFRHLCICPF